MKAIVQNGYGSFDVLSVVDREVPEAGENQVLVEVHAVSVNAGDLFGVRGTPFPVRFVIGFPRPRNYLVGWDFSGVVTAVGRGVTDLSAGDDVYGFATGTFAEFITTDRAKVSRKPANLGHPEAAAIPTAGTTALQGLRDHAKVTSGQAVLVTGASGGVGSFAVQIAVSMGATVSGVCRTEKMDMVRALGADRVIDYTSEDFTTGRTRYDVVFDNAGTHTFAAMRRVLKPGGIVQPNSGHGGLGYVIKAFALGAVRKDVGTMYVDKLTTADLEEMTRLVETGTVAPYVDEVFPFEQFRQAFEHLDGGHAKGKVCIAFRS